MSKELTIQEANRVIAEYMDEGPFCNCENPLDIDGDRVVCENCTNYIVENYNESLDALVPVWEKLGRDFDCYLHRDKNNDISGWLFYFHGLKIEHTSETIQEAACIATAKAIKELEKRQ